MHYFAEVFWQGSQAARKLRIISRSGYWYGSGLDFMRIMMFLTQVEVEVEVELGSNHLQHLRLFKYQKTINFQFTP